MTINDWFHDHPDDHVRIICYVPAPDIIDEYGNLSCGGEGTSTVVFDSTTGDGDLPFDLLPKEIINDWEDSGSESDGAYELEYLPDSYYIHF